MTQNSQGIFFYKIRQSDTCQKTVFQAISLTCFYSQQWYQASLESVPTIALGVPETGWEFVKLSRFSRFLHQMQVCAALRQPLQSQANLDISHPRTSLQTERTQTCAVQHSITSQVGLFTFKLNKIKHSVPQSQQSHSKCSTTTCGQWLPYQTAQIQNLSIIAQSLRDSAEVHSSELKKKSLEDTRLHYQI